MKLTILKNIRMKKLFIKPKYMIVGAKSSTAKKKTL